MTKVEIINAINEIANKVERASVVFEDGDAILMFPCGVECEALDELIERLENEANFEEDGFDYEAYSIDDEDFGVEIQYKE